VPLAHELIALASNETLIYGAVDTTIHVFAKAAMSSAATKPPLSRSIEMKEPIERLVATNDRLFVFHTTRSLSILKTTTSEHQMEKRLLLKMPNILSSIYLHAGAFLVMLNRESNSLSWYDMNGNRHNTPVANCPPSLVRIVNSRCGGKLVFWQNETKTLYFQSS
jgi:hypothetical protein